jgi:transcriptional regulator with GAF, ATPase, and Fis domain
MARSFLKAAARRLHVREPVLGPDAEATLLEYDFPGNVRELQNVIERAVVLAPASGGALHLDLSRAMFARTPPPPDDVPLDPARHAEVVPSAVLRELRRRNIVNALARCDYQIAGEQGAAKMLGMSPSTLAYHIKRLGIRRAPTP